MKRMIILLLLLSHANIAMAADCPEEATKLLSKDLTELLPESNSSISKISDVSHIISTICLDTAIIDSAKSFVNNIKYLWKNGDKLQQKRHGNLNDSDQQIHKKSQKESKRYD